VRGDTIVACVEKTEKQIVARLLHDFKKMKLNMVARLWHDLKKKKKLIIVIRCSCLF
jgi:polynucleotide 5'-kinase involved in rRNA processing